MDTIEQTYEEELKEKILTYVKESSPVKQEELAEKLGISLEQTAAFADELAEKKQVLKTNTKLYALNQVSHRLPKSKLPDGMKVPDSEEEALAKAAVEHIRANDTVYITSGSVGFSMLKYLKEKQLPITLVTNSVLTANEARKYENVTLLLIGGTVRKKGTIVDAMASRTMKEIHVDICFMTGAGVTAEYGLTNNTTDVIEFMRSVLSNARKKVLMMPAEKVGFRSFLKVCDVSTFDVFITSKDSCTAEVRKIQGCGPCIELADVEP